VSFLGCCPVPQVVEQRPRAGDREIEGAMELGDTDLPSAAGLALRPPR
jgi:hypothetical protein